MLDRKIRLIENDSSIDDADDSKGYWNDQSKEENKVFNIKNGFEKLENSKKIQNLLHQLNEICLNFSIDPNSKKILSIASGICWIESKWLSNFNPISLTAVEYSKHRIFDLAPKTFEYYKYNYDINLINSDIFDLDINLHKNYDIILLCQAFHHIDEPLRLLRMLKTISNPSAKIIIMGEPYFSTRKYLNGSLKHFIKLLINYKGYRKDHYLFPSYSDIFPAAALSGDPKGDIHYSKNGYKYLFKKSGPFKISHLITKKTYEHQAYVLEVIK